MCGKSIVPRQFAHMCRNGRVPARAPVPCNTSRQHVAMTFRRNRLCLLCCIHLCVTRFVPFSQPPQFLLHTSTALHNLIHFIQSRLTKIRLPASQSNALLNDTASFRKRSNKAKLFKMTSVNVTKKAPYVSVDSLARNPLEFDPWFVCFRVLVRGGGKAASLTSLSVQFVV